MLGSFLEGFSFASRGQRGTERGRKEETERDGEKKPENVRRAFMSFLFSPLDPSPSSLPFFFSHPPFLRPLLFSKQTKKLKIKKMIFFEHVLLYNVKGETHPDDYCQPLEKAGLVRSGKDITILCYSRMRYVVMQAVAELENQGYDPEVVDLISLKPFDMKVRCSCFFFPPSSSLRGFCLGGWGRGGRGEASEKHKRKE